MIKLKKTALANLLKLAWWDGHNQGARHTRMVCDSAIDGFMEGFEEEDEDESKDESEDEKIPKIVSFLNHVNADLCWECWASYVRNESEMLRCKMCGKKRK